MFKGQHILQHMLMANAAMLSMEDPRFGLRGAYYLVELRKCRNN